MQIVIFDTELTPWEVSMQRQWSLDWDHREVIQIVVNSTLSDYIIQLTGIEQHVSHKKPHSLGITATITK